MCGIAGIIRLNGVQADRTEIENMTASMAHRGPDSQATWVNGSIALGHTRLSIIDQKGGGQPMICRSGQFAITYNGEIYNYLELRKELKNHGCRFHTQSDTEVVLKAYQKWGVACVERLDGMFAFGIVDFQKSCIFLARDHSGIKPLMYRHEKNFFAFASEIKALLKVNSTQPTGSLQSIDYYLRYQYIPAPDTIYKEIKKLLPAHTMVVGFDGSLKHYGEYWRIKFNPEQNIDNNSFLSRLDDISSLSIKQSMVADVPVGIFCSGGLDSTLVASRVRNFITGKLLAFTVDFSEKSCSELPYAQSVSQKFDLELNKVHLASSSIEALPEILDFYGEPFGDPSAIPVYYISRCAKQLVSVVLSGDGGDELFGGYDRYFLWRQRKNWFRTEFQAIKKDLAAGRYRTLHSLMDGLGKGPETWSRFVHFWPYASRKKLWKKDYQEVIHTSVPLFEKAYQNARHFGGLGFVQAMDFETYLPCDILTKIDIGGMSHGLETRPVLLSRPIVDMAAIVPEYLKYTGGSSGKAAIRHLLSHQFDQNFLQRPKKGFGIPLKDWFLPGKKGHFMLREYLVSRTSPLKEWFCLKALEQHVNRLSETVDNSYHLWLLLALSIWRDGNRHISFS